MIRSRREILRLAGLGLPGLALVGGFHAAAEPQAPPTAPLPARRAAPPGAAGSPTLHTARNRFPRMMQDYFGERIEAVTAASIRRRDALASHEDAVAHVSDVRAKIRRCFGPWPEKTPLEPRVTGVIERDGYRIENVLFESRPGFLVSANLYVPTNLPFPRPGVVGACGHSITGKGGGSYQPFAQGLAKLGYVVLIFDPIGQGERLQYVDDALTSKVGVGVLEHLHVGNQQTLVGESFATWRAWDGIRALDYLLTRPEVDASHVGVTGNSGGGTMTTWLCALDDRWTMAAPSCFVTTFLRNFQNELPTDPEQCPPGALALGLDHEDFIAAMAPKPVIVLAKEEDFFDVRGTVEAVERLRRLYRLLGAEEALQFFIGPGKHGFSRENREAMYRFFDRQTGVEATRDEPPIALEEDATLWTTPHGQVSTLGSRTVQSFTRERAAALAKGRRPLSGESLRDAIRQLLALPNANAAPRFRILRTLPAAGYPRPNFTTYAIGTDPGVEAIVYRLDDDQRLSRPPRSDEPVTLYVSHRSADHELRTDPWLGSLARSVAPAPLYTCDVRGVGESRPDTCGPEQFLEPYGSDYFYAVHASMLASPYVGQRTFDLLRVLDWLRSFGHREIRLVASGWGTLPATFAAVLARDVTHVTLRHALTSYTELASAELYDWPLSCMVPDVLAHFDLPDCRHELERTRTLVMLEPRRPDVPS